MNFTLHWRTLIWLECVLEVKILTFQDFKLLKQAPVLLQLFSLIWYSSFCSATGYSLFPGAVNEIAVVFIIVGYAFIW